MSVEPWIVGKTGVPRTGGSSLDDDELVVCDALFGFASTSLALLLHEDFNLAFNLPYGGIEVVARPMVERMVEKGIIELGRGDEEAESEFVCLSPAGRTAWEIERRPVWDAYCSVSRSKREGVRMLKIRAVRGEVAEAYLKAWMDASPSPLPSIAPRVSQVVGEHFPYWRTGPFAAVDLIEGENTAPADYAVLTRRRIWWTGVTELLESHRALKGPPGLPPLFGSGS